MALLAYRQPPRLVELYTLPYGDIIACSTGVDKANVFSGKLQLVIVELVFIQTLKGVHFTDGFGGGL